VIRRSWSQNSGSTLIGTAGGFSARRVRIVMPDDMLSDMNDVLPQGAGWHVQSDHQPWPEPPAARIPEWQHSGERD
jgi:hypothetical protein